jgi:hypothetical protein
MNASAPGAPPRNNVHAGLDSSQRVLQTAWHPNNDVIGVGSKDFGFLYLKQQPGSESEEVCCSPMYVHANANAGRIILGSIGKRNSIEVKSLIIIIVVLSGWTLKMAL